MSEKLMNISYEIIDIFKKNDLSYGECLKIIYLLKESIDNIIFDTFKDSIISVFKDLTK